MCAAGAGRPLPRCVQKTASKDVVRENAARSKTSHAHAQRSRAVRHPHAVARKVCSPLPEGGEASLPLCLPTEKRHALPMPLPSAVAKAPPSGRLASPARRASQKATPAESQLSAQNKRRAPQLPLEPGAKKRLATAPFRRFLFAKRGRSPSRSQSPGKTLPFVLTLP